MNKLQIIKSANFGEIQADIYSNGSDMYMTINQLAECLEYADKSGVERLLERNHYLKDNGFSYIQKVPHAMGGTQKTRTFTEDGIYEVTMLSSQPKAKEFRAWVRKVLKSLRTGKATLIPTAELERQKLQAQQDRARAMLLNAQNRALKTLMSTIEDKKLSPIAIEVFGLKAIEQVTGLDMGSYLPQCPKTYSATEIGKVLGISHSKVGALANKHNLKTDQYGITVMDKSRYSPKEVASFRYYDSVIPVLRSVLNV